MNTEENQKKIIRKLLKNAKRNIENGYGPFYAAIYDEKNKLIAQCANSVVKKNCSNNHAEMNVIKLAEKKLNTYDLSSYNLSIYITAEPCIMCTGAIMWSGIKNVYYSVSSKDVEEITGFDEGFKQNWIEEFEKRGIKVVGNIEEEKGKELLKEYAETNKIIYKPKRK